VSDRSGELRALLEERVLVLDGATGTMLQARGLTAADFGGPALEGCNEVLVVSRPEVILDVHRAYLEAGADIIETDTFGGTRVVLAEYGLEGRVVELNRRAAELARAAVAGVGGGRPRFVAGSMGPTTKAISVTGGITFPELVEAYAEQARGLLEGGVDLFLVETCQDTRNAKAALIAVSEVLAAAGVSRPVMVSGTVEASGTMLAGQSAEAFVASLSHLDLLAIGLNCAVGPELMTDHLRSMHDLATVPLACYPNAGLPDEEGRYRETPEAFAAALERFVDAGWLNLVGGCCGTTERHVAALAAMVAGKRPRRVPTPRPGRVLFSGVDLVELEADNRPLLVGERTNVIGSRKFARLVGEERWDEAAEVARAQVRGGAQVVDVCLQSTERDEVADVRALYERLARVVKAPLMVDSTDPRAVEVALTYCQGRAIVNSVNLEEGERRLAEAVPLLRRFGAAVVVGCIDDHPQQAQAFTRERKLEVALRSHRLLTERYGLRDEDLVFDPLVFPVASGDESYIGAAVETLEGLRLVKDALPRCATVLGISNVSFGLPPAAREVVNSVFLYLATRAGLDLAIVNTERLERYASIAEEVREEAEDLLLNRPPRTLPDDHPGRELLLSAPQDWREQSPAQRQALNQLHIARLTERFRGAGTARRSTRPDLPLEERLGRAVVEGSREGLVEDLRAALDRGQEPLDVVNGPLMAGMAEVGRLFAANQLIVAEVLQSAEVMKAAVSYLEPFMAAGATARRGSIVLATVKGDVHDIGKNLVEIILANNGFEVLNLGIRVSPEVIVEAVRQHRPDAVGLSGLLVKSAQQMVATAEDLRAAGVDIPLLVGGAALSEGFSRRSIAPAYGGPVLYCQDAMQGLDTMNRVVSGRAEGLRPAPVPGPVPVPDSPPIVRRSRSVRSDLPPLPPPHPDRRVLHPDLAGVFPFVNPQMLYGKHLGLRGAERKLGEGNAKAAVLRRLVEGLQGEGWMRVSAVYRFFEAEARGNTVELLDPVSGQPAWSFTFPRQRTEDGLCLADYVLPARDGVRDSVALFVVTAGAGVRERAEAAKGEGEYLRSHVIQALALETAEAAAEWVHALVRGFWGFPDPPELTMKERFRAAYRGRRYSFGYPACPDLDDQVGLFGLLAPQDIGVELTDGMMMDPEASVSAVVFHHPDATYFAAGGVAR